MYEEGPPYAIKVTQKYGKGPRKPMGVDVGGKPKPQWKLSTQLWTK